VNLGASQADEFFDRLQDAMLTDVVGEFVDLGFRKLGPRVACVFEEARHRHGERRLDHGLGDGKVSIDLDASCRGGLLDILFGGSVQ
jgi:hypothetical protein